MKKILLLIICITCLFTKGAAQFKCCFLVDGYWSPWGSMGKNLGYGSYHTISFYDPKFHPSQYYWKFSIDNFVKPSEADIKYHYSNNIWYEYTGTVEYYISDALPTAKDFCLKRGFVAPPSYNVDKKPRIKQVVPAIIKIAPYKDHPKIYNVFFENVGLGFDLNNYSYPNW